MPTVAAAAAAGIVAVVVVGGGGGGGGGSSVVVDAVVVIDVAVASVIVVAIGTDDKIGAAKLSRDPTIATKNSYACPSLRIIFNNSNSARNTRNT